MWDIRNESIWSINGAGDTETYVYRVAHSDRTVAERVETNLQWDKPITIKTYYTFNL